MSQVKIFEAIPPPHCLFRLSGLKGNRWMQWVLQGQQSVIQGFFSPSFHALYFIFYYIKPRSLIFQDLKKALQTNTVAAPKAHTAILLQKSPTPDHISFLHLTCSEIHHISARGRKGHKRTCSIQPAVLCP